MTTNVRNTEGPAPRSALEHDLSFFPPADSLEDKYQTALLMTEVLRVTYPHINMAAWRYHLHAKEN